MGFLVIDGNSILNRAFYGIRVLTNSRGVATNAVTGFMNTLLMLEKDVQPDMIAVAFDLKAPTFRHKMYDGYKANRKGMPEDLAQQLPYMKKIIKAMGIAIIEQEGYEADDIIGTISAACADKKIPCTVSTGDRDSFQLVNDYVTVRLAKTKGDIYYTPGVIEDEYGVTPKQMIEVKALMGDTSDNIPGVRGIGEKTALSLIKEFASVDGLYENIDSTLITDGLRNKLINGKESCYMSRKLAEICLTAPIDTELSHYIPGERDDERLAKLLSELEMYKMLQKLQLQPTSAPAGSKAAGTGNRENQASAMPKGDIIITDSSKIYAGGIGIMNELSGDELRAYANSGSTKYTFDIKETLSVSGLEKLENNKFDTTLAAYLADPDSNDYSMSRLCTQYGVPEGNSIQEKSITVAALNDILYDNIHQTGSATVLTDIEIPLATVLVAMEREGVKLDIDGIKAFGEKITEKAEKISREIYEYAGYEFNIGSPKQLGSVLFEKLKLSSAKKTKTGRIGVIATAATISTHNYKARLEKLNPEFKVFEKACPLFVPLVENGFIHKDDQIVRLTIKHYLTELVENDIDTLILGCTHYPLLADAISSVIGNSIELIDSGYETALYTKKVLGENNLLNNSTEQGASSFFVSDTPEGFESVAELFLGKNMEHTVTQIDIEKY